MAVSVHVSSNPVPSPGTATVVISGGVPPYMTFLDPISTGAGITLTPIGPDSYELTIPQSVGPGHKIIITSQDAASQMGSKSVKTA